MTLKEFLCLGHDLGTKKNGQDRQDAKSNQSSADNGGEEVKNLHLKYAGGEDKQLERRWWRQHGRNHQGQELLPFKAVANALQSCLADSFQHKQLAAGAPKEEGDQA